MLDYVYGHDEAVAHFVAQLIPESRARGLGKCKAIGVVDEAGNLLGGLVYHKGFPEVGTIRISSAAVPGTNWLSRRTIQIMYDYPIHQVGCQMVIKSTMSRQLHRAAHHAPNGRFRPALHQAPRRARSGRRRRHSHAGAVGEKSL